MSNDSEFNSNGTRYVIPAAQVLKHLGLNKNDLSRERVSISVDMLKKLIVEALRLREIDEEDYLFTHSDVRSAILAGEINSGREHYCMTGYFENRAPGTLPFDPEWYYTQNKDISQHFTRDQEAEMEAHFVSTGYAEGRPGTEQDFLTLKKWME